MNKLLDICRSVPGQQVTVAKAEAELGLRDLRRAGESGAWEAAGSLEGPWLPEELSARPVLLLFRDAAREVFAGTQPEVSPVAKVEHFTAALQLLDARNFPPPEEKNRMDRELLRQAPTLADAWRALLKPMLEGAQAEAAKQVPNVFTNTGQSLDPASGRPSEREVFRGRESCIQQVADALEQPKVSLAVIGPRRVGKTSLLKMITVFLPGDIFVYVDLQSGAGASPEAFCKALDTQLTEALRRHTGVTVPRLGSRLNPAGTAEWIAELEAAAVRHRVVFCIDEYERLEALWSGGAQELTQLLALIRSTIQHRNNVRFLIAGASPLADLPPLWTDHFISAQEIRVDFLDHDCAIGLLRKPSQSFPDGTISQEVAEAIYARTAGQPHLLQTFGFRVVQRINKEERKIVTLDDVQAVEDRVLQDANNTFADYRNAPPSAQRALESLARDQSPVWEPGMKHWLRQHGYLTADSTLRVPLFKTWLRRFLEERE
ncbi:MAG TPA: AAA family ATPase [Verrucomicrobiales bacterium]|nr:AAA family ATPase [Verrucomicrobiales bacterium]